MPTAHCDLQSEGEGGFCQVTARDAPIKSHTVALVAQISSQSFLREKHTESGAMQPLRIAGTMVKADASARKRENKQNKTSQKIIKKVSARLSAWVMKHCWNRIRGFEILVIPEV